MDEKKIETARGSVYYWIYKNADLGARCIVFTHGLTADHSMFEMQETYFQKDYTVIMWDVPLHGKSKSYRDFSYRNCAEDLHTILEAEGLKTVVLIGMSMGGYVCQEFALQYPDAVAGFVGLDTTPFGHCYYSRFDLWCLKQAGPMAKWYPVSLLKKTMAKSVSYSRYSYEKMREILSPLTKGEIAAQMDVAYGRLVKENRDAQFSFPVLILVGDHDKTGKVKTYCYAWTEKTGYPLHVIKNAAHFSNGDNPQQVNAEIEEFVQGLR